MITGNEKAWASAIGSGIVAFLNGAEAIVLPNSTWQMVIMILTTTIGGVLTALGVYQIPNTPAPIRPIDVNSTYPIQPPNDKSGD